MELIKRTMTISLDMEDCETILSWYRSEQEKLLKGQVTEEWKRTQTATSIFKKMMENYYFVYQFGKVPRWGETSIIKESDVIDELKSIYGE